MRAASIQGKTFRFRFCIPAATAINKFEMFKNIRMFKNRLVCQPDLNFNNFLHMCWWVTALNVIASAKIIDIIRLFATAQEQMSTIILLSI